MKIAIVDGIEERAPLETLARALRLLGHDVMLTERLTHGFSIEIDEVSRRRVTAAIDGVVAFGADVVFAARPAGLPVDDVVRLRATGAVVLAWLSDDPVLWQPVYRHVVEHYDILLHCGGADVIAFYEKRHPGVVGVNFPFWSDSSTHPHVYGRDEPTHDLLFLGNTHDPVRRGRYELLTQVNKGLLFHGRHGGHDPARLWAGYLDSDEERAMAAGRARAALSVSQQFADYRGHPWWFTGLEAFGEFEVPSRLAQYAAYGLPVVHVRPDGRSLELMPEVAVVRDAGGIRRLMDEWQHHDAWADLGAALHARGQRSFSAMSRALMLEHLVTTDDWRTLHASERARLFQAFDGRTEPQLVAETEAVPEPGAGHPAEDARDGERMRPLVVGVLGQGWLRATSRVAVAADAIEDAGHSVVRLNPWLLREFIAPLDGDVLQGELPLSEVLRLASVELDVLLVVGREYALDRDVTDRVVCVLWTDAPRAWSPEIEQLVRGFDTVAHVDERAVELYALQARTDVLHLPELAPGRTDLAEQPPSARVGVVAEREADLAGFAELAHARDTVTYLDDRDGGAEDAVERLRRACDAATVVVLPDLARGRSSRLLPWALRAGRLVAVPRVGGRCVLDGLGERTLGADDLTELEAKLAAVVTAEVAARRGRRGRAHAEEWHDATYRLDRLVRHATQSAQRGAAPAARSGQPAGPRTARRTLLQVARSIRSNRPN